MCADPQSQRCVEKQSHTVMQSHIHSHPDMLHTDTHSSRRTVTQRHTFHFASSHHWVVLLVCVFTSTLGAPGTGVKISSPLEPELPYILGAGRDPSKRLTLTAALSARHTDAFT